MNDSYGVLGQVGPERSKRDQILQKEFGKPKNSLNPLYQGSSIGVIGNATIHRSVMDKKMQQEFGGLNKKEGYEYDTSYKYRSSMDQVMNLKFNPFHKEDYSCTSTILETPYNLALSRAKLLPLD